MEPRQEKEQNVGVFSPRCTLYKATARHPVHAVVGGGEPSLGCNHHRPQTAVYKCGAFAET